MSQIEKLNDRILGMYAGVSFGDAFGMPYETMKQVDIMKQNEGQGALYYADPVQTRNDDTKDMKLGDTTDDWQLTQAVNLSLVQARGLDMHHQAMTHIQTMQASIFGWGKGTMQSLEELRTGKRLVGEEPLQTGLNKGAGNGVVMKIAPIAALTALTGRYFYDEIIEFGKLTHSDMRARIAPVAVYMFLVNALLAGDEPVFTDSPSLEFFYQDKMLKVICELEQKYVQDVKMRNYLSNHLVSADTSSLENLIATAGVGFTAWQTAAFTLGVYRRHPQDFTEALREAVNAGGDTDTNASVVGALVGATVGYSNIPEEWKTISVVPDVKAAAQALCETFG